MSIKRRLIIALAAAFAVRIILIVILGTYKHPVMWEYEDIVNNMLAGKGFLYNYLGAPYRSFNNPLYSFMCAGLYLLTNHSYFVILMVQSVFSILLALVIFNIARILFDEKTAFISAVLVAFHPAFVYYDVFNLVPLSIDSFLVASVVLFFLRFKARPTVLNISLVGALIGLGALTRGIIGSLMPFLIVYLIIFMKKITLKERARMAVILSLATFIVIAPWIVRNYIVHKKFVFIISTTGETFWRANNKYAVGTSLDKEGNSILKLWPEDFRKKVYGMDELAQNKFLFNEAVKFIRANPRIFITSYLARVYYFWWFSPQSGIIYPRLYTVVYKCVYSVIFIFFIFGIITALRSADEAVRDNTWLVIFILMAICATQSLFYVEGRHRFIVEPLMMIFFAHGAMRAYNLLNSK